MTPYNSLHSRGRGSMSSNSEARKRHEETPDTVTITISRDDAEIVADSLETSYLEWNRRDNARLAAIFRAALEEK